MQFKKHLLNFTILALVLLMLPAGHLTGQGCSDAGACSIGSVDEPGSSLLEEDRPVYRLSLEQSAGLGEKFTFISQTSVSAEFWFLKQTSVVVRTPFIFTSGNLGNSSGIGDVLISLLHRFQLANGSRFGVLAGGKIRSNHADFGFAGQPLPMAYQTSLGTYDIILGVQYLWKTWDLYLAYQHPFGRNRNEYLQPTEETNGQKLYFESAQLRRGDDLALRVQKSISLKNGAQLQPGVMPIYRIQKSEITRFDENEVLENSNGLTLNLFLTFSKQLGRNSVMNLTAAFPVIDRDYRADGLTRNFVITLVLTQFW